MSEEPRDVKCADCGWLGVRVTATRELVDGEHMLRASGNVPSLIAGHDPLCDPCPVCFANYRNFYNVLGANPKNEKVKEALLLEFHCPDFTAWKPGLSPKELQNMLMLKEQRIREDARDQALREHQASESKLAFSRHLWMTGASIAATLLAAAIGAIATLVAVN